LSRASFPFAVRYYVVIMFRDELHKNISQAVENLADGLGVPDFSLEAPENAEHGDYATNMALLLAKPLERNPTAFVLP